MRGPLSFAVAEGAALLHPAQHVHLFPLFRNTAARAGATGD